MESQQTKWKRQEADVLTITNDEHEPVQQTVEASVLLPSTTFGYHQILVSVDDERYPLQVTFDNNEDKNYWSFRPGLTTPNVSELFHMEYVDRRKEKVKIFEIVMNYISKEKKEKIKWYLSLQEDRDGLEKYPKFRPEDILQGRKKYHTIFKAEFLKSKTRFALSFKRFDNDRIVYLVPELKEKRIERKEKDIPDYVFECEGKYIPEFPLELAESLLQPSENSWLCNCF